jgi:hypothetical protein
LGLVALLPPFAAKKAWLFAATMAWPFPAKPGLPRAVAMTPPPPAMAL